MRKSLWILAAIGFVGIVALTLATHTTLRGVTGVEEAVALQETLRPIYDHLVEPTPPLMVYRVPGSPEWPGFRWKVEATLRPGRKGTETETQKAVERIKQRALATAVQGRRPSGLILVLHVPGGPDHVRVYNGDGFPLPIAVPSAGTPK